MRNLKGKTILITGASSGIGRQLAVSCAKLKPDSLIIAARRLEKLKEIESLFTDLQIISIKCDLSNTEGINDFLKQIEPYKRKITHVFNNAGFGWYGYFNQMTDEKIVEMINLNILSLTKITKFFLDDKLLKERDNIIHIFNIGSIAGFFPVQGIVMYSSTKSFVDSFTRSLHSEYAKNKNIFFTLVLPGAIKTDFFNVAQNSKGAQKIRLNLFEYPVEKAVAYLIKGIFKKKKVIYIPPLMKITNFIGFVFGRFIRSLGPILLNRENNIQ